MILIADRNRLRVLAASRDRPSEKHLALNIVNNVASMIVPLSRTLPEENARDGDAQVRL